MTVAGRLREQIDGYYRDIRHHPGMFGTPTEIEAMWWVLLGFEALLVTPTPDDSLINDSRRASIETVVNRRGWPGSIPLHRHVWASADFVVVLDEVRDEFLRLISARTTP